MEKSNQEIKDRIDWQLSRLENKLSGCRSTAIKNSYLGGIGQLEVLKNWMNSNKSTS